jgi:hypothetical protein
MAEVSPWTGDTYDMLYAIFRRDFVETKPRYCGHVVWHFPQMEDGKETLFWHLTSREVKPKPVPRRMRKFAAQVMEQPGRYPDLRRSERLPWVRPLIENSQQSQVLAWDYEEGNGDVHTYVWLKNQDFVAIMKKYPDGRRRLITSFYVDKEYKRRSFERKYADRIA